MAEGALLASDPNTNGLFSAVFKADPKAGTSGLAAADPNVGTSALGADSAPNDNPSGFPSEGDPKVGTSGFTIEIPNAGTSGFAIDDPKAGTSGFAIDDPNAETAGFTADGDPNEGVSVFEGAPNVNIFEGVVDDKVVAVEVDPPKLDVAEIVGVADFPNKNAVAGADSDLTGAPKAGVA